ncbi:hypothetical protein C8Q70DRAFT_937869 [Cubamyces menziesii]|nr:hypothetical protein C8Q70DRAFT_937869 [Cubamyces menziesii]
MPKCPACRSCAQKKVACKIIPGTACCQRCIDQNISCKWPAARIVDETARRKSCIQCREKHAKCEMHKFGLKACYTCLLRGFACSYDADLPSLIDDVTASTPVSEEGEGAVDDKVNANLGPALV